MDGLQEWLPDTFLGITGGLSHLNIREKIADVAEHFKHPFCVDAQGRLRTKDKKVIDLSHAHLYAFRAEQALRHLIPKI